ncbi:septum formation family protein [Nocardioides soli]|uniref:Septum formation-related domain-containing protein n=1 Tax=Nocardioides soli TaxID=1036020 RepID=A0A7W4Z2D2_9ACTN|nr:septum formation family protein [Nocardioides soli]MBB3043878.1 hypothetical protein [Nocardioides soli]
MRYAVLALAGALLLAGCSGGDEPDRTAGSSTPSATASDGAGASTSESPRAAAPARPKKDRCYRLDYTDAIAPTNDGTPMPCKRAHTSRTVAVGDLDTVVDGHLLAVDSRRVRDQVAEQCPQRFAAYVGGSPDARRLSMLRPIWFTPTVEQSDAGASWYRCDVVAIAGDERLANLTGDLRGVLGREEGRDRYGMCGTAEPGTPGFERVICSAKHTWRAVATVPFEQDRYPGVDKARSAGDQPCRDAGAAAADGALDYRWGYEWPSAKKWRDGQRYGLCWAPDS